MKFEVFTIVRLGWLDGLWYKFRDLTSESNSEKKRINLEQIREIEMRNAEYWNKIATILLDFEWLKKDYISAIDECGEVFEAVSPLYADSYVEIEDESETLDEAQKEFDDLLDKAYSTDGVIRRPCMRKKMQIIDVENDIVGAYKDGSLVSGYSRDVSLATYYLEKLYSYLTETEKTYVDENLKNKMFERLKKVREQSKSIEWYKECCSEGVNIYNLRGLENMNFEIFTLFRNEWLDELYLEFYARMYLFNAFRGVKESEKIEMKNVGYWNEVARILLDFERIERDEPATIKTCFEVFKKEHKNLKFVKNRLRRRQVCVKYFLSDIVGSEWTSTDVRFVVYYLKAMYDCLPRFELPYVDEKLKNEMFEQIEALEAI